MASRADRPRIAFVTAAAFPEGTPDDRTAWSALAERGIDVVAARWDDASVDWSKFRAAILRSTWDYHLRFAEWSRWLETVAGRTTLWNPPVLVHWNVHKRYLVELAGHGVPVVPTVLLPRGGDRPLEEVVTEQGWEEFVVKPEVGANAHRFFRGTRAGLAAAQSHLTALRDEGDVLVQPYWGRAETTGERSIVYFGGRFSHATEYAYVARTPEREPRPWTPSRTELRWTREVVGRLPVTPLYARFDLLPAPDGPWNLGELELIEPELFLRTDPGAPERFARAIARVLG